MGTKLRFRPGASPKRGRAKIQSVSHGCMVETLLAVFVDWRDGLSASVALLRQLCQQHPWALMISPGGGLRGWRPRTPKTPADALLMTDGELLAYKRSRHADGRGFSDNEIQSWLVFSA